MQLHFPVFPPFSLITDFSFLYGSSQSPRTLDIVGTPGFAQGHRLYLHVHSPLGDFITSQCHRHTDNSQLLPQILAVYLTFLSGLQINISRSLCLKLRACPTQTNKQMPTLSNTAFQQASHFSKWISHTSSFNVINLGVRLVCSPVIATCNPLAAQLAVFFKTHRESDPLSLPLPLMP